MNSRKKEIVKINKNGKDILVTLLELAVEGDWIRVYKKPNGQYVGKLDMKAPNEWKFEFSFPY